MACEICKKQYVPSNKNSLFDSDGKPHVCNTCGKSFSLKIQLKRHMLTHEGDVPYICNSCEKRDNQSYNRRLSGKDNYVCEICNKIFSTKRLLLRHVSRNECEESFMNVPEIKKRISTHKTKVLSKSKTQKDNSAKPYQCWDCEKSFTQLPSFKKHSQSHKKHKCGSCNASFTSKEGLDNHRSSGCSKDASLLDDSGEKKHVCSICDKSFTRKSALEGHVISHLIEKTESGCEDDSDKDADFLCNMKSEKLVKQSLEMCLPKLKIRRSYPCDICEKVCASKKVLEKHLLSHKTFIQEPIIEEKEPSLKKKYELKEKLLSLTQELKETNPVIEEKKKYVCRICNETFLFKADYKKHKLAHTPKPVTESNFGMKELKTYVCKICTEVFNKKKHLKKHYFKIHESSTDQLQKTSSSTSNENPRKKHKRSKDLACKTCGKLFAGETCLKKHEARHGTDTIEGPVMKEKKVKTPQPLICPFCDEDYSFRRFAFMRHKLSHTPEVCGICDARFTDRLCLREHLKTHIGTEEAKRFLECGQKPSVKNVNHPDAKVEYIYLVLR